MLRLAVASILMLSISIRCPSRLNHIQLREDQSLRSGLSEEDLRVWKRLVRRHCVDTKLLFTSARQLWVELWHLLQKGLDAVNCNSLLSIYRQSLSVLVLRYIQILKLQPKWLKSMALTLLLWQLERIQVRSE